MSGPTTGPELTCADLVRQAIGCEFFADEEQFYIHQFGVCENQSDDFNYTFSMKTINSGPFASSGTCQDNCQ